MRALVTGASGFLGQSLVLALERHGVTVIATSSSGKNRTRVMDVTNLSQVEQSVESCDIIFHLAATAERNPIFIHEATRVNTLGASHVMSAVMRYAPKARVILVGSAEEYGPAASEPFTEDHQARPCSIYGASKLAATELALSVANRLDVVVVRPSVIYGPRQPAHQLVAAVSNGLLTGKRAVIRGGSQVRDLVFVDDVVDGLLCIANVSDDRLRGRIINFSSGVGVTVKDIAFRIRDIVGEGDIDIAAPPERSGDIGYIVLDPSFALSVLGWKANTGLDQGLLVTVAHARSCLGI